MYMENCYMNIYECGLIQYEVCVVLKSIPSM